MASRASSAPRNQPSAAFPRTIVYVPSFGPCSKPRRAWLSISSNVRWIYDDVESDGPPRTFSSFTGQYCLALERLREGAQWSDVEQAVRTSNTEHGRAVIVNGRLSGRKRLMFVKKLMAVFIVPDSEATRESWTNALRIRVAPWRLLRRRMSIEALNSRLSPSKLLSLLTCLDQDAELVGKWESAEAEINSSAGNEGADFVLDGIGTISNFVETVAAAVKMSAPKIQEYTELVADMAKCVTLVGATFQVISLGMMVVDMVAERERGAAELPKIRSTLGVLRRAVLKSMLLVLHPHSRMDELLIDKMFEVQEEVASVFNDVELQMMRKGVNLFLNAGELKRIESSMERLKDHVLAAVQSGKIAENACAVAEHREVIESHAEIISNQGNTIANLNDRLARQRSATVCNTIAIEDLRQELHSRHSYGQKLKAGMLPRLPPRSKVSNFFVGRSKEIDSLARILKQRGSAVISQFGGAGKTQLMSAFAEWAEQEYNGLEVFWATAVGDASGIILSLVSIAEKILGMKLRVEECQKPELVVAALERGLSSRDSRWFICLDNVDNAADAQVSSLLEAVCSIAKPSKGNGWVLATTRQSHPTMWPSIKADQMLKLGPLAVRDSMILLCRLVHAIRNDDESDEDVWLKLKKLEEDNAAEYISIKSLCDCLAGLPLALVQAGAYLRKFKLSFSKYLKLYEGAGKKAKLEKLLPKTAVLDPVNEEQRAILTTWTMNVDALSTGARQLLRLISMLGNAPISESFIRMLLTQVDGQDEDTTEDEMYTYVLIDELVYGSSLVQKTEGEAGDTFDMHRLIRLFVLMDMKQDTNVWNKTFVETLTSTHDHLEKVFGASFSNPPHILHGNHLRAVPHTLSIVHNARSESEELERCVSNLWKVHEFTAKVLQNSWRDFEARDVWQKLLASLKHHPLGRSENQVIAAVLSELGQLFRRIGKLNQAADTLRECLEIKQLVFGSGKDDLSIAGTLDDLGVVYERQGNLDGAEELYIRSLNMKRAIHGHDAVDHGIASTLNCLGNVYLEQCKFDDARRMRLQCLEMTQALFGKNSNHPDIAAALMGLGRFYQDEGNLDGALEKYRESLGIRRALYGADSNHPEVAKLLNNMGMVYKKQGKLNEALDMNHKCLRMRQSIYGRGANHPDIADSLNALGSVFYGQRKFDNASKGYRQSLEMMKVIYGCEANHPGIALVLTNLGCVYQEQGKVTDAVQVLNQSLEMRRTIYGRPSDHPDIAASLFYLGSAYMVLSKLDEAKDMFEASLNMCRRIFGHVKDHPDVKKAELGLKLVKEKLIARALVAAGANVEKLEDGDFLPKDGVFSTLVDGKTPLHICASLNLLDSAEVMVTRGAPVNVLDCYSRTPVMFASEMHHVEMIKFLRKCRSDPSLRDENGNTALHYAVFKLGPRRTEIVRMLSDWRVDVNAKNDVGFTALHVLADSNEVGDPSDVVDILVDHGADVNARDKDLRTPLIFASKRQNVDLLQVLVEKGAVLDLRDKVGKTALHCATFVPGLQLGETLRILCDAGADVNAKCDNGNTAIYYRGILENPDLIHMLVDRGAVVNLRDKQGDTPLHDATNQNCSLAVPVLVNYGADVNARNEELRTPLFVAAHSGYRDCVAALIVPEVCADITIPNKEGITPLQAAASAGYDEIVSMLSSGRTEDADAEKKDDSSISPLFDVGKRNVVSCSIASTRDKKKRRL